MAGKKNEEKLKSNRKEKKEIEGMKKRGILGAEIMSRECSSFRSLALLSRCTPRKPYCM